MNKSILSLAAVALMSLWLRAPAVFAADEICASCGQQVGISGEFAHRKDDAMRFDESALRPIALLAERSRPLSRFTVRVVDGSLLLGESRRSRSGRGNGG